MKTIDGIKLKKGSHRSPEDGLCLMEAVAYVKGLPHSDEPRCTCKVLAAMGRGLNDCMDDAERQKLKKLIPHLIGTAEDGRADERARMAQDWIVRTYTPAWLELAGLAENAKALRNLPEIRSTNDLSSALGELKDARKNAAAARDAARAAAGDAARAAAGAAAGAAAWDAAWAAARAAAWDAAWAAAGDAAQKKLKETTNELRESAFRLFRKMIRPGKKKDRGPRHV